jgi:GTPase SAR1 family protein
MGQSFTEDTVTTIGYDFSFLDRNVDQLQIRYQLWDSAGQEKYRSISPIHYKSTFILIFQFEFRFRYSRNCV